MNTNRRTKYVLQKHEPSTLPFPAHVDFFRNRPKLLGIFIEQVDINPTISDPYKAFFEKNELPYKMEKKDCQTVKEKTFILWQRC